MIAHNDGRSSINHCHRGTRVSQVSWPLRPAAEEAAVFSNYFDIDMLADTPDIYFFSGIKKRSSEDCLHSVQTDAGDKGNA